MLWVPAFARTSGLAQASPESAVVAAKQEPLNEYSDDEIGRRAHGEVAAAAARRGRHAPAC